MKKAVITAVALTLVLCLAVGGTLAYLTAKTDPVTNTFTYGNVDITLTEKGAVNNAQSFKMVPGDTIKKEADVAVVEGSEDCWLFIKVEKANKFDTYMDYEMAAGWTALEGQTGVYYREAKAGDSFDVLAADQVVVKSEITKAQMEAIGTAYPTMTFTAYAVQKAYIADAATAWVKLTNQ